MISYLLIVKIWQNEDAIYYMSLFEASVQFRQLSLLWRRHKFKAELQYTDEARNKAETRVYI